ncbi:MAG: hypothetical protein RL329_1337 [Bacteroidota bacterium]|jgi:hypothetical protein
MEKEIINLRQSLELLTQVFNFNTVPSDSENL